MGGGYFGGFKNTKGALKPRELMDELRESGVKFKEEDVVLITKTKINELVWLEKGDNTKGLEHILRRHEKDLERKFGLKKEDIPSFVKDVFTNGIEISRKFKNGGFQKEYLYKDKHIVISGVGTNGFIVSIYPK
jgi:hypothetical protein